jgi:hypothetical protein
MPPIWRPDRRCIELEGHRAVCRYTIPRGPFDPRQTPPLSGLERPPGSPGVVAQPRSPGSGGRFASRTSICTMPGPHGRAPFWRSERGRNHGNDQGRMSGLQAYTFPKQSTTLSCSLYCISRLASRPGPQLSRRPAMWSTDGAGSGGSTRERRSDGCFALASPIDVRSIGHRCKSGSGDKAATGETKPTYVARVFTQTRPEVILSSC